AYGNGLFVLAGTDYTSYSSIATILTSPNGKTWTPHFSATNLWLDGTAYVNGSFLVSGTASSNGADQSVLLTSPDGSSWNFRNSLPAGQRALGAAYRDGLYVLAGDGVWTSLDTITWQERVPANVDLLDITYGADLFVAVGSKIFTSTNGNQWTIRANDLS